MAPARLGAQGPALARSSRSVITLLIAAGLALPLAAATWHGIGTSEPDTAIDATAVRMFAAPDTSPTGKHVYFDAFPTQGGPASFSPANGLNANPNVGLLGSRIEPAGLVQFNALLG